MTRTAIAAAVAAFTVAPAMASELIITDTFGATVAPVYDATPVYETATAPVYDAAPIATFASSAPITTTLPVSNKPLTSPLLEDDVIVYVPTAQELAAQSVAPVDVTNVALVQGAPAENRPLDMSGVDGSLRACYQNGGIAKQSQDFNYYCSYDSGTETASAEPSPYWTPSGIDTGYEGTTNVQDEALLDCMSRGGTLIQLVSNEQFACAM